MTTDDDIQKAAAEALRLSSQQIFRGDAETIIARAIRAERDAGKAALEAEREKVKARELSDNDGCCEGCGSTMSVEDLRKRGALSCCPERKMLSAKQWRERAVAAEAQLATARNDALEEAAKAFETVEMRKLIGVKASLDSAAAIRKMKEG